MGLRGHDEAARAAREEEVVDLLSRLIRADTSNPPGDVRPAVAVLEDFLRANRIEPTLVGESPELTNCIARLPGSGGGPTLVMLGHTDVVPADAGEWSEPPFAGVVKDGYVWGRGALDMKNQVAAHAVALARLARRAAAGERLRGDLVFVAVADEETGDRSGARWLVNSMPELLRADFVINEGGSDMLPLGDRRLFIVAVGEKGYAGCRIVVRGRGGHGSMPQHEASVAHGLARIIGALEEHDPEVLATHIPTALVDRLVADERLRSRLKDPVTSRAAVRELAGRDAVAAGLIEPLLGLTFATTIVRVGGEAVNIIPSRGEAIVDCRMLPGQTGEDVRREVARALAGIDADWELTFVNCVESNESPAGSALFDAIGETLQELAPGADVVAGHSSGFTDSAYFRAAYPGCVAYGFAPFVVDPGSVVKARFHSRDERIAVRDLVLQAEFTERLAVRMLG